MSVDLRGKVNQCVLALALMTMLLFAPLPSVCQEADNPSLSLQIAPVKSTLLVGEPILIECLFTNISDEPIGLVPWVATAWDFFQFTFKKPDGTTYQFLPGIHASVCPDASIIPVVLSPGESCRYLANPLLGKLIDPVTGVPDRIVEGRFLDFVLQDTGRYEITVTFSNSMEFTRASMWRGTVTSNTISVEVKQPTSEADVAALAVWESSDSRSFFLDPGFTGRSGTLDLWHKLINTWPESTYALYANYYLAAWYMQRNPPQYENAIEQFRVALGLLPESHPLHAMAEYNLGVCLLVTGRIAEGVQNLESFVEKQKITSTWVAMARSLIASPAKAQSEEFDRRKPHAKVPYE